MNINYSEEAVTINGAVTLQGTLTIPENSRKQYPAMLFLSDAGEVDRDGNSPDLHGNILRDLASAVTEMGFATLRYDKRGVGESGGNFYETGLWDLADDAASALFFLKNHHQVMPEQLFLLGHGEGTVLAPILFERQNIQGIILLAPIVGSYWDVIVRKEEKTLQEINELKGIKGLFYQLFKISDKIEDNFKSIHKLVIESSNAVIKYQGSKLNAKWMREHYTYNVKETLRKITCPTLAIAGTNDLLVSPQQSRTITRLVEKVEFHLLEELNHVLRKDPEPPRILSLMKDYQKFFRHPIDAEVIQVITSWLNKQIA